MDGKRFFYLWLTEMISFIYKEIIYSRYRKSFFISLSLSLSTSSHHTYTHTLPLSLSLTHAYIYIYVIKNMETN